MSHRNGRSEAREPQTRFDSPADSRGSRLHAVAWTPIAELALVTTVIRAYGGATVAYRVNS